MDPLEQELKAALQKIDPSPFFESRVLAAANRQAHGRKTTLRMRWFTATAALALVVVGVFWQHQRAVEETARGQAAKARLMVALRITSTKLDEIQEKVDRVQ
jgi:hypothetical protein